MELRSNTQDGSPLAIALDGYIARLADPNVNGVHTATIVAEALTAHQVLDGLAVKINNLPKDVTINVALNKAGDAWNALGI